MQPGGQYIPITNSSTTHRVAILIPYRNRESQLPIFMANIHPFLIHQNIEYRIFVIEQISEGLFNRAALMNAGFLEALKLDNWTCFVLHDIDMLPTDSRNMYTCLDQPRHMSVAVDANNFSSVFEI